MRLLNLGLGTACLGSFVALAFNGSNTVASDGEAGLTVPQRAAAIEQVESLRPAALIHLRLSRGFLEDYIARTVEKRGVVEDVILGTRIVGGSLTSGKTYLVLHPSDGEALAEVEFLGTVQSRTTGYNGPATLQYVSDATFRARKRIVLGESGLSAEPAIALAPTRLRVTQLETSLPGLRGRIAKAIAWRRVNKTKARADAVASQHAAARIGGDLDERIDRAMAELQATWRSQVSELGLGRDSLPQRVRFGSTPDFVEVAMYSDEANAEKLTPPPAIQGNPDIAIRVHRTVVADVVTDSELRQKMAPLFADLFEARIAHEVVAVLQADQSPPSHETNWSVDLNWLTFDFTSAERQTALIQTALHEPP